MVESYGFDFAIGFMGIVGAEFLLNFTSFGSSASTGPTCVSNE